MNHELSSGHPETIQRSKTIDIPSVEITDSPGSLHRMTKNSASLGSMSGFSYSDDSQASSCSSLRRETSLEMPASPSRRSMEAMKKVSILL